MSRRWQAAFPMLLMFAVIWIAYVAVVVVVVVVDPYDIYHWGTKVQLRQNQMPRGRVVRLIEVVTKKPTIDTFLVGGSTTAMYSPDEIAAALGGEAVAYNLSYGGPKPLDRDIVLNELAETSHPKRIIITFERAYILDAETMRESFPNFLYDDDVFNDIRMVDLAAMRRTVKLLWKGTRSSSRDADAYPRLVEQQYRDFQKPPRMSELQALIEEYRPVIDASSGRTCASFRAVNEQLVPRIRQFAQKGIEIDVVMPILSYAYYYFHVSDISPTILDEVLMSRQCFIAAVAGLANVRVFAFDQKAEIAGDLGKFRDPGHVYDPDVLKRILGALSTGENMLTEANVADYVERIRAAVKSYDVRNSYLERTVSR